VQLKIINDDSSNYNYSTDLIFTDPPFDMSGKDLNRIMSNYKSDNLVLITSIKQLLEFSKYTNYEFSFDFVLDAVQPKKSKSIHYPNYTHQNIVYFKKGKSVFNRKLRQRSDVFKNNGYWNTIFRAPRERGDILGMAKNTVAITDIIGSFDVKSVIDPFAGSLTTAIACYELNIDCICIEKNSDLLKKSIKQLDFIGADYKYV